MTFLDASVIIAILCDEQDGPTLLERLLRQRSVLISPVVTYEAVVGIARIQACSVTTADAIMAQFSKRVNARIVPIDGEIARLALLTFERFGKGRHPAGLNMGDCFAYACARSRGAKLLFKGEDFSLTDIEAA